MIVPETVEKAWEEYALAAGIDAGDSSRRDAFMGGYLSLYGSMKATILLADRTKNRHALADFLQSIEAELRSLAIDALSKIRPKGERN